MIFLPIVDRELRVASRQRATYHTRLGSVLAGVAIGGWIMLMPWNRTPQRLGMSLFIALSLITFIYALLIGLRTTADCISEEKREGTLGLLFLTDLKGFDIVFGKMAATSLNSFYGMLGVFPIMAISILAGGVSGGEFWRVTIAAVNNVFFSLSVGMFCSAISRDERKSMFAAFGIILLFCAGLPTIGYGITDLRNTYPISPLYFIPSPAYTCFIAFDETARAFRTFNYYYPSLITVHVLAWIFLALSCWIIPRTWHDKVQDPATRVRRIVQWLCTGSPATRLRVRRSLLFLNPFYWLTSRDRSKIFSIWLFMAFGAALWAWGLWKYPNAWKDEVTFVFSAMIVHTILKIWLTTEAARQLSMDRRSGALELLLSTPLTVRQILRGQLLALWKQFAVPVALVILTDLIFLSAESSVSWKLFWIAITVVLILDMVTLAWVGMWSGLVHKSATRASGATVAKVMALPWAILLGIMTVFGILFSYAGPAPRWADEDGAIVLGFIIAVVVDVIFYTSARRRLLHNLRETATQRFETRLLDTPTVALRAPACPPAPRPQSA